MKKIWRPIFLFCHLLLFCNSLPAKQQVVKDGTFLLRQKQRQNAALKSVFNGSGNLRANNALLDFKKMVPGQSEIGFQVYNFAAGNYEYKPGIFMAEGSYCRVFIEKQRRSAWLKDSETNISRIVSAFDELVYPTVTSWFGKPVIPDHFSLSDDKIFIFLVDIKDNFSEGYVAGYFDHRDLESLEGNQKPLFFMDIDPGEPGKAENKTNPFYRTLAHEFQHMVSLSRRVAGGAPAQDRWLDEGFSMFSEFYFSGKVGKTQDCLPPSPHYERFIADPVVNLFNSSANSWFQEDHLYRQYGASFLFVTYLIEKFAGKTEAGKQAFVRKLVAYKIPGAKGLDSFLSAEGHSLVEVFQNWTVACYLNDKNLNNGLWNFNSIKIFNDEPFPQLPLKRIRHFYAKEQSSFVGAQASVIPNSVQLEEITGNGLLNLQFSFAPGMTPGLILLGNDNEVEFVKPGLDSQNYRRQINFSLTKSALVLPLAVKDEFAENERLAYSLRSESEGLSLYPLPNPAFADQFIILLKSTQTPLSATPTLNISFNNIVDSPEFSPVGDDRRLFVAHYRVPGSGKGQAVCYAGEDSCSFSFSAAGLNPSARQVLQENSARLVVDSGAHNGLAFLSSAQMNRELVWKVFAGPFDVIIPSGAIATLSLPLKQQMSPVVGLLGINAAGEALDWREPVYEDSTCKASVLQSGCYILTSDQAPPELKAFEVVNEAGISRIKLQLHDELSGIDPEKVSLRVNGKKADQAQVLPNNLFFFQTEQLRNFEHEFLLSFADKAGNQTSVMRHQMVSGSAVLQNMQVFPNPARHRAGFLVSFSGPVSIVQAKIKIFDSSGAAVAKLEPWQSSNDKLRATWNLRNSQGYRVANGVYMVRAEIQTVKGRFKINKRLSVLR
jgi:hypothetical protein